VTHGIPIEFTHNEVADALPEDTALCLYRIVQEGLRNTIKHSGGRRAGVQLNCDPETIGLRIVDDGAGFDPGHADRNGGLGLVSMRERLYLVGGSMTIDSRPSEGTCIDVRVPIATNSTADEDAREPQSSPNGEALNEAQSERQQ
jgi:signal transduction histidine kinase